MRYSKEKEDYYVAIYRSIVAKVLSYYVVIDFLCRLCYNYRYAIWLSLSAQFTS